MTNGDSSDALDLFPIAVATARDVLQYVSREFPDPNLSTKVLALAIATIILGSTDTDTKSDRAVNRLSKAIKNDIRTARKRERRAEADRLSKVEEM